MSAPCPSALSPALERAERHVARLRAICDAERLMPARPSCEHTRDGERARARYDYGTATPGCLLALAHGESVRRATEAGQSE